VARLFLVIAAMSGFVGVALGAFGAHALRARLGPERLAQFETGVRYHLWHTLALYAAAVVGWSRSPRRGWFAYAPLNARDGVAAIVAAWLFVAGILLFSGSLYALALTGRRRWGAVTPFGGVCFLLGWLALGWAAVVG
jgi:uncharacterized membrane protein YgdD (TMEM256/DUF423 family)